LRAACGPNASDYNADISKQEFEVLENAVHRHQTLFLKTSSERTASGATLQWRLYRQQATAVAYVAFCFYLVYLVSWIGGETVLSVVASCASSKIGLAFSFVSTLPLAFLALQIRSSSVRLTRLRQLGGATTAKAAAKDTAGKAE